MHVIGTKMDYVEDRVRAEFVFVNPNAKGKILRIGLMRAL